MDIKWLGWVDLETTGTDEHRDPILELGFVLTDLVGNPKWAYNRLINPNTRGWQNPMNETVREMHTKSGLLDDVEVAGQPIRTVEANLIGHLGQMLIKKHEIMLAGSGVGHFDKRFLEAQMPHLHDWFAYPVMDVGVIRWFLRFAGAPHLVPELNKSKTHRAMDDLNLHLAEYRHYVSLMNLKVSAEMAARRQSDMATLLPGETATQDVTSRDEEPITWYVPPGFKKVE